MRTGSQDRKESMQHLLQLPAIAFVFVVMAAPLSLLARFSLETFDRRMLLKEAFTLDNYIRFFSDPFYIHVLLLTTFVACLSTLFCLLVGLPMAYRLARMRSRAKSLMVLLTVLPMFVGGTVRTIGWMILLARGGILDASLSTIIPGTAIDLMYTPVAVVIGMVSITLPYLILTLRAAIETIDTNLEEAALSLGATPAASFRHIVWPLALPGVAATAILSFILCMNAYATPVLLGGTGFQMMAPVVYWEFTTNNNWPFASAMAFILMASTLILSGVANHYLHRRYR